MKMNDSVLRGYENAKLVHYSEMSENDPNTVAYEDLGKTRISGVLKANRYINGKLMQTFTNGDNHALAIAATRLGKTTSCVIPLVDSFAKQKEKRNMVISDPKGEIYRLLADELKKEGYDILLLNLRDYVHSELWNPLIPIYREYRRAMDLADEVEVVETPNGLRNRFQDKIYEEQAALDSAIEQTRTILLANVDVSIDNFLRVLIPPDNANDQYWNDSSRQWGKAVLLAMLEDSNGHPVRERITEDTFSLHTMFTILEHLNEYGNYDNDGYFSDRGENSRAYNEARAVITNSQVTRKCIVSCFQSKTQIFRSSTIRFLTRCSSFSLDCLVSGKPTAIFIDYPDENKTYYHIISMFIQQVYTYLIEHADRNEGGKLKVPFYCILDEFGNFPKITDFDTVISACGGRNIWFYLVLQSYAQLENVYGKETAVIIRDNLNVHIFLGSNNPDTLEIFSHECGKTTRISPLSALNGDGEEISRYDLETVSLVPRSALSSLSPGECILTEATCGYVLFSKMERYYQCKEYAHFQRSRESDYQCRINPFDSKYSYRFRLKKGSIDDDFNDLF